MRSTWPRKSSGVVVRLALYATKRSDRNVCRETSKHTARWVGCSSRSRLMSMAVKPYTALVVCPVPVRKFSAGRAKKAR